MPLQLFRALRRRVFRFDSRGQCGDGENFFRLDLAGQRRKRFLRHLRIESCESRNLLAVDFALDPAVEEHAAVSSVLNLEAVSKAELSEPHAEHGGHEHAHDHAHAHDELILPGRVSGDFLVEYGGYLTEQTPGAPLELAEAFLDRHMNEAADWDLSLREIALTDIYSSPHTGVTHAHFQQRYQGLPIANSVANVNVTADGSILNAGIAFLADDFAAESAAVSELGISQLGIGFQAGLSELNDGLMRAEEALVELSEQLSWGLSSEPEVVAMEMAPANRGQHQLLSPSGISVEEIPAELQYVAKPYGLELAWRFIVERPDGNNWYDAHVSAVTGEIVSLVDWVTHASYNVFAFPKESPLDGPRTLETDPHDLLASEFGWHDTDGAVGAEFITTRGNNVWAYADRDGNNQPDPGSSPSGGLDLQFDFPVDFSSEPLQYQAASAANLFYWSNILHDIHYRYGFNEAAGNFQENNYGNGGVGGDFLLAETQDQADLGVRNNANFASPPDGSNPRMQMFLWDDTTPERDSSFDAGIVIHEYAHGVSTRLTGGPSNSGSLTTWQSRGMGEGWSDWHALMLTQTAADAPGDTRGVGNYALGQSTDGPGIRTQPYSYDMSKNNLTYADINGQAPFIHFMGEVWAATLWDLNWALIEGNSLNPRYGNAGLGFDPDLYGGSGGNNLALQLVMDGMKLQPANPSFLDARDAILDADVALTGGQNQLLIWEVFARRGMGYSAFDGGDSDSLEVIEAFDIPATPNGVIDFDEPVFDEGSWISLTLRDSDLSGGEPLQITTSRGDVETVDFEADSAIGVFFGAIDSSAGEIGVGDGVLQVADGDVLTVEYVDADDGNGGSNITKTSTSQVQLRRARTLEAIGPEGGLMGVSNDIARLRSSIDVEPFTIFAEAGELVGVTARPYGDAVLNVEIVGLSAAAQSPAAGEIANLAPTLIPVTGEYQVYISSDAAVVADVVFSRNAVLERSQGESEDGNELLIDASAMELGGGRRYAASAVSAPVGPGIVNGSFETGDFTGWNVLAAGNALVPWLVSEAGDGTKARIDGIEGAALQPTSPQDGSFVAWNGFDGAGPMDYLLTQEVLLPTEPVSLTWKHRIQWDFAFVGDVATEGRTFEVQVRDTDTGEILATLYDFDTEPEFVQAQGDTGWLTNTVDLGVFAGEYVQLAFVASIPQVFTGPGQFEIDDVQLIGMPSAAPDVDEFEIDFSGKSGELVDIVLASSSADFAAATMQLLDVDGVTVLQTATTTPLGNTVVSNYRQGILGFEIPADGQYTLRVSADVFAEYQLLVTESLAYDTEPNDNQQLPLRSLDSISGSLGFVDGVSSYSVNEVVYDFADIVDGSLPIFLNDDQISTAREIGFDFEFYGQTYSQFYASSNGFITFLPDQWHGCCIAPPIPDPAGPNGIVAAWWRDLIPETGSFIRYKTTGTAGQQVLNVEYRDYAHFSDRTLRVTMMIKLFEATGDIEIHYLKAPGDEFEHVVGIENSTGTEGLQYYRGAASLPEEFAIRFARSSAVDRYSLTLEQAQEITLRTQTPLADTGQDQPNILDPELRILSPAGVVVAQDLDSADGKNAEIVFEAAEAGVYTVEVVATSGLGGYLLEWFDNNADRQGPRVTDVIVGSTDWSPDFIDLIDGGGDQAGNGLGLSLVGGQQLDNLPWVSLNKLYVQFDEDVAASFNAENVAVAGLNLESYAGQFTVQYGVDGSNVGTITFSEPIQNDVLQLNLSEGIKDKSGNSLDGEWNDGSSSVSGNGTNGGPFRFRMDVLAGDVNDTDGVNLADVFDILNQSGELTTFENLRLDVNGSGGINLADVFDVLNRSGASLPPPG